LFVDCVGFKPAGTVRTQERKPAVVLNQAMAITRAGGSGIPGLYVTEDPGATDEASKQGSLKIRFGLGWAKSHSFHTGQTPVMKYHRQLMNAILNDKINIAKAVNAEVISLKDAPEVMLNLVVEQPKVCNRPAWNDSLVSTCNNLIHLLSKSLCIIIMILK
jgi:glutathione-independent formaldehyde dehydrogenase